MERKAPRLHSSWIPPACPGRLQEALALDGVAPPQLGRAFPGVFHGRTYMRTEIVIAAAIVHAAVDWVWVILSPPEGQTVPGVEEVGLGEREGERRGEHGKMLNVPFCAYWASWTVLLPSCARARSWPSRSTPGSSSARRSSSAEWRMPRRSSTRRRSDGTDGSASMPPPPAASSSSRAPNLFGGVHLELFDPDEAIRMCLEGDEIGGRFWPWPEPRGHSLLKVGRAHLLKGEYGLVDEFFHRAEALLGAAIEPLRASVTLAARLVRRARCGWARRRSGASSRVSDGHGRGGELHGGGADDRGHRDRPHHANVAPDLPRGRTRSRRLPGPRSPPGRSLTQQ